MMNDANPLKLLLADDERAVQRLYTTQLLHHIGSREPSHLSNLEQELFDEVGDVADVSPAAVTVCSQGREAVDRVADAIAGGNPFHAVVLDVRMPPGIDGVEAAVLIREIDSAVPIIFLSGYSDHSRQEIDKRVPPPNRVWFISKPIRMAQLAEKILEVTAK